MVMIMESKRRDVKLCVFVVPVGLILMHLLGCGARVSVDSITADFTGSPMQFVDSGGVFLASRNGTFNLMFQNPSEKPGFYLCVAHAQSGAVVWSANRVSPIFESDQFLLTQAGAVIQTSGDRILWSAKGTDVGSLQLRDDGNLVMLDSSQFPVWQSFDYPTDTLLPGQPLVPGARLVSNAADDNYSLGDYEALLTQSDLALRWGVPGFELQTYWTMSTDSMAINLQSNSALSIAYAAVDQSGLNLYSSSSSMVLQIPVTVAAGDKTILRRAVIDSSGQLQVLSFASGRWLSDFDAVENKCLLPTACGRLGICGGLGDSLGIQCSCPGGFQIVNQTDTSQGCKAPNAPTCISNYKKLLLQKSIGFVSVGGGLDYFAHAFQSPIQTSAMEDCEQMCLKNCSCALFFYVNASASCFLHGLVGTMISSSTAPYQAYLKVIRSIGQKNNASQLFAIVFGLTAGVVFVAVAGLGLILFWYRKKIARPSSKTAAPKPDDEDDEVLLSIPGLPTRYSYTDLQTATGNFSQKIGSGGFGVVYEGTLPDQTKVAVKKLDSLLGQGKKEFYSEIAIIGSIHHVNLVKLRGFCVEGSNRLLVYEYMSRGSLDRSLFGYPVLEWKERCDIALGTAKGLAYLHHGCREKIIHCDIKPENILLDVKSETKVSDFGLAKLLSREESQAFTTMRGTRGYLAPEWLTNSSISDKTDVYSFGMVLLELIGGRKNSMPNDTGNPDQDNFDYFPTRALRLCEERRFSEAADPRLEGRFCVEEVEKLVKIALCCVHEDSNLRPSMSKVVHMLEGNVTVEDPQVDSLMFLRIYARRINSSLTQTDKTSQRSTNETVFTFSPSPSYANASMISAIRLSGPR